MVAMSGGVDSSVAAYLIKQAGYEAAGATLRLFDTANPNDAADAKAVAESLGMDHYVFDLSDDFRKNVIENFISVYRDGGTPNPCIVCNKHIKFGKLLEKSEELGFGKIATGHYARVEYDSNSGRWLLKKAGYGLKDQSYVLYSLSQRQLASTLLPIGNLSKPEVREIADANRFVSADRPDSQDICFIPDGDYARFIENFTGESPVPGNFIDRDGNILGTHKGIIHYTLGQCKRLGIALGHRVCVCGIDADSNTITLGSEPDLMSTTLTARNINLIAINTVDSPIKVTARTRYSHREEPAILEQTGDDEIMLRFERPQRAITKGQSVVIYSDEVVIGGGIIV